MTSPAQWSGLFAVLVTPFTSDGALDEAGVVALVDFYLGHGATGLVVASVMGEGTSLTDPERERVVRLAVERCGGRVPVLLGSTSSGVDPASWGVGGVLVSPRDVRSLARATDLPLVLLDYPPVTGTVTVDELVALLGEVPRIAAIKLEHVPSWHKMAALRARVGDRLRIFGALSGMYALSELDAGSDGLMTGAAAPDRLVRLLRAYARGDVAAAQAAYVEALPFLVFEAQQGVAIAMRKAMLVELGVLRCDLVRPPTAPLDAAMRAEVRRLFERWQPQAGSSTKS
jgi:4-hydroxy-tetrahydrodipicolinate synthase